MAEIEEKVVFTGDASQLQQAFEQLVNDISRTREELKTYKDDKEKSVELTKKLADQEMALADVIKKNNNVIDASNVSYRELNDILKDLNKTYKTTGDAMSRADLAPAIKAINGELKSMDANIGNFQRNVGNYEGAITSASKNISSGFMQVAQSLPSITESPERFFMALARAIPQVVEAIRNFDKAQKAAAVATEKQVELDKAELTAKEALAGNQSALNAAKVASAGASQGEEKAAKKLTDAEIKETQVTIESQAADVARIATAKESVAINLAEAESVSELIAVEDANLTRYKKQVQARYERIKATLEGATAEEALKTATDGLTISTEALTETEEKATVVTKALTKAQTEQTGAANGAAAATGAAATGTKTLAAGEEVATVATKGLGAALSTVMLIGVALFTIIAVFGKDILEWARNLDVFNNKTKEAARFQKDWNEQMREGHKNAAKQITDLKVYYTWATSSMKADKQRTIAAKKVLELLGSAVTETNIAALKNGEFKTSIDEVTNALIRQAQAEAMLNQITAMYKPVAEAQSKLIEAKQRQGEGKLTGGQKVKKGFIQWGLSMEPLGAQGMTVTDEDILDEAVKNAEKAVQKATEKFNNWLKTFTSEFNPAELLLGDKTTNEIGKDDWFSKTELFIKNFEPTLERFQGEFESVDLGAIWKYSDEGYKKYIQMYDEYIKHYKKDEKAKGEAEARKAQYIADYNAYHQKLLNQYIKDDRTEKEIELAQLEEWKTVQGAIYKNAGEDTTALVAEYERRKADIEAKYADGYKKYFDDRGQYIEDEMTMELKNIEETYEKELAEYQRKGIETSNLTEYYEQQKKKIISKYAKEAADAQIEQIDRVQEYQNRRREIKLAVDNMGGIVGSDGKNREDRYAAWGGTSMFEWQKNDNELEAAKSELETFKTMQGERIAILATALSDENLIGDERLQMEQELADARVELELGVAERMAEIHTKEQENTRAKVEETLSFVANTANGLGDIFGDVYTAIENVTELRVKQGKITEEQAEKELETFRGIQAAQAAMSAIASSVEAYKSTVQIPVVGPYLAPVAAAAALTAGFANVALILATTKDNIPSADSAYEAMPTLNTYQPQYTANITGLQETEQLANALSKTNIWVSVKDINSAQKDTQAKVSETRF